MPVYEFLCADCGPFEQRREMEKTGEPMECPVCGRIATRIYSSVQFSSLSRTQRELGLRSERGSEPRVVSGPIPPGIDPSRARGHVHRRRPWMLGR